jgi:hypothetical protein
MKTPAFDRRARALSSPSRSLVGVLFVAALSLAACGGGSGPTAPSAPMYPAVAGNYAGVVSINVPLLGASLNCPATTTVTQSGANVTFAPLALSGNCSSLGSFPLGDSTISTTGSLGSQTVNNLVLSSCNGTYSATASGGFFGSSLQFAISYTAVSGACVNQVGNFTFSGTLTKQ